MYVAKRFFLSFTFLLDLCCRVESLTGGQSRKKDVHNPHIDVAILLDNSASMHWTWDKSGYVWEGMQQWIRDYYNKDTSVLGQTHFAVIACGHDVKAGGDVNPALYFDQTQDANAAQKVIDIFDDLKRNTKPATERGSKNDNVNGCAKAAATKIFETNRGDRPNAPNVVVFVSDCTFYATDTADQYEQMRKLKEELHLFLFVCTREPNKTSHDLMVQWVGSNQEKIYIYKDKTSLVHKLNDFLPKITVTITTCGYDDFKTTQCQHDSRGKCSKTKYPVIVIQPSPAQYLEETDKCPKNDTIDCNDPECRVVQTTVTSEVQTTEKPIVTSTIRRTTEKHEEITVKATTEPRETSTQTGNITGTSRGADLGMETVKDDDSGDGVIIGIIIGLLVLLLLIILILLLVMTRRKKGEKKTKGRGYAIGVKQREKHKGIKADLTTGTSRKGKQHAADQKKREKEKGMQANLTATKTKNVTEGKGGKHSASGKKTTKNVTKTD